MSRIAAPLARSESVVAGAPVMTPTISNPAAVWIRRSWRRVAVLAVLVLGITVGHYFTSLDHFLLHNIYQRLYYIPVLLACAWFGITGGLVVAAVCAGAYAPHILLHWGHSQAYQANQILELGMFGVVALFAGALSDRERRLRLDAEATAAERDRALHELESTIEGARRADRLAALGTLTAGIAHEIRNPLGAIAGAAEILERDFPADHPRREFLDILRREIARLGTIANKYLDYARPQAPELRPLDVNTAVHEALALIGKNAGATIAFETRLADGLPTARGDAALIQQVLVNVILNAVQAMPSGGTVEIVTAREPDGVSVCVRDHGAGIPDVPVARLFEPFFTTKAAGTGLGLHVCQRIAESHGGRLDARNAPDGGAIFRLVLPASAS